MVADDHGVIFLLRAGWQYRTLRTLPQGSAAELHNTRQYHDQDGHAAAAAGAGRRRSRAGSATLRGLG